mmetsp:Transcript_27003/g.56084  ORF Transcript_27003/g.56084 Transcript_27003/m.56084 type:complete len:239 (+) Transcript_27003:86-802(+)
MWIPRNGPGQQEFLPSGFCAFILTSPSRVCSSSARQTCHADTRPEGQAGDLGRTPRLVGSTRVAIALGPVAGALLVVGAAVHVLPVLSASTATAVPKALTTTTTALLAPATTLLVRVLVISISVLPKLVLPRFLVVIDKFTDQVAKLLGKMMKSRSLFFVHNNRPCRLVPARKQFILNHHLAYQGVHQVLREFEHFAQLLERKRIIVGTVSKKKCPKRLLPNLVLKHRLHLGNAILVS